MVLLGVVVAVGTIVFVSVSFVRSINFVIDYVVSCVVVSGASIVGCLVSRVIVLGCVIG